MVNDKKGQQMTLGTIIAIVLGIAVLVFLIFGFSTGWSGLWDRVTQFGGGSNVDTVVQACALKCSTGDTFAFCDEDRTLKDGTNDPVTDKSCEELRLSNSDYGIGACGSLCN